jgi:hypothetical protein
MCIQFFSKREISCYVLLLESRVLEIVRDSSSVAPSESYQGIGRETNRFQLVKVL